MPIKQAAADDAGVDKLLREIYEENPRFWPHGLSRAHFDGGLYLLSKQAGEEPVGFVGWQERQEGSRKIGYYSVGVLPEHRRKEYAKRAVSTLLQEKSASVDEVRAMIVSGNIPSKALAGNLEGVVVLQKEASGRASLASVLLGGIGNAAMWDQAGDPHHRDIKSTAKFWEWDKERALQGILNAALGMAGGGMIHHGINKRTPMTSVAGISTMALSPVKDLSMKGLSTLHNVDRASAAATSALTAPKETTTQPAPPPLIPKEVLYGGLGLGAAGLGIAGIMSALRLRAEQAKADAARGGRIRVTLPTKNPGDSETTIDLPTENFDLSKSLYGRLKRDTRSRLLSETRQRTRHRKPKDPNNLTEKEREDMELAREQAELEQELDKAARFRLQNLFKSSAAIAVPSPPAQGTNPALRMSQQAMAAQQQAQGASTDANPQIAQAEQAAAAAEQNAQAQVAQEQQKQQAEAMQRDQAHQQELAKKDQEVFQARQEIEMNKMEVEKAKVELELAKAKMEAAQELEENKKSMTSALTQGDDSAVARMTKQRLSRIGGMLKKVAMAAQPASTTTTPTTPAEFLPNVAQRLNDRGHEYQAHGGLVAPHLFRTSFGKLGDKVYGMLARPWLTTPSRDDAADWASLSPETIAANPDAFDSMLRIGNQFMNTPRV